jgi:hypothetical protein
MTEYRRNQTLAANLPIVAKNVAMPTAMITLAEYSRLRNR